MIDEKDNDYITRSYSIDRKLYEQFKNYCDEHGIIMSGYFRKQIRMLLSEEQKGG